MKVQGCLLKSHRVNYKLSFAARQLVSLGAFLAATLPSSAVVYRPGLLQAKFTGTNIAPADREATLIENLATQTDYTPVGALDYTYGTLMANSNGGDGGTVYNNFWRGTTHNWANNTLFAYEGEIFVAAGQKLAMGGCFDDGSAAKVNGTKLFTQGNQSGYNKDCTILATFEPTVSGWYPVNAWVWDWSGNKNIRGGYVSGIAYNLVGDTSQPTNTNVWSKLTDDGKMSLLRVKTDEHFLTVTSIGKIPSGLLVPVSLDALPANCQTADVVVCWGATDGGTYRAGWDHSAVVRTASSDDVGSSFAVVAETGTDSTQYVRVLLSHIDSNASPATAVSSFEDWSEPFANPPSIDAGSAIGTVRVVSPAAYVDSYPQGVVSYFGDDASSATVLVQFCASEDFNGDIFETQPKTFSAPGATKADFIGASFNGKGAGYIRLKIVNDKEMTSYSSVIPYTPPALIDFMDYAMKAEYTVAYNGTAAEMDNFPVCVRLAEGALNGFSYADCAEGGADLAFFDEAGTMRYSFEIDEWNTNGESIVWVRLPSAAQGAKFAMCYGRANQSSGSDGSKVWSEYAAVLHMAEASGTVADSTGNGHNGVPTKSSGAKTDAVEVMTATNGPVGRARINQTSLGAKTYSTVLAGSANLALGTNFVVSGWFHAEGQDGSPRLFSRKNYYENAEGFEIELGGSKTKVSIRGGGKTQAQSAITDITTKWLHLTFAFNGTSVRFFQDGAPVGSYTVEAPTDNGKAIAMGGNSNGSETCLYGEYDEARISVGTKSDARIAAEYATMADDGFLSTKGAMSTDADMAVIDSASVAWESGATKVTVTLSGGKGAISAEFTDELTGVKYTVQLAETLDATEGAATATYTVPTSELPAEGSYRWTVYAMNEDVGRTTFMSGSTLYYAGVGDFSVRFVKPDGNDADDGLSYAHAKATIQAAVDVLGAAGGTVKVMAGEYVFTPPKRYDPLVTITAAVEVVGMTGNAADVIIKRTTESNMEARGFKLSHPDAKVHFLTLDGMFLHNSNSSLGGGFWIVNGTVEDCVVLNTTGGHWDSRGLGAYIEAGRISRCVFKGGAMNRNTDGNGNFGAGVYADGSAVVEDCLIAENRCETAAALVLGGNAKAINCTIANNCGNTGNSGNRSGVWTRHANARVINCAIFENYGADEKTRVWDGTASCFVNCASDYEITGGTDCITGDPGFVIGPTPDYHLTPVSCAFDAGTDRIGTGAVSMTDLDGNARVVAPKVDIGCYEHQHLGLDASFVSSFDGSLAPVTATFRAASYGAAGMVEYAWDFDGDGTVDKTTADTVVEWQFADPGYKTIVMTATDGVSSKTITLPNKLYVSPTVVYVDGANAANAVYPYATLETATADLQEALDMARDGAKVLVADGTYTREIGRGHTENGFSLTNGTYLASISGDPERCILRSTVRAGWDNFNHRCLNVNHPQAFVTGITFADGSLEQDWSGACVNIGGLGGTVSNCVMRGGRTTNWGSTGAAAYVGALGLLTHCVISNCNACSHQKQDNHSVLNVRGRVENCLLTKNGSKDSHNIVYVENGGQLLNCTIVDSTCVTNRFVEGGWHTDQCGVRAANGSLVKNCVILGVTRDEEVEGEGRVIAPWTGTAASFVNCATDGASAINETCILVDKSVFIDYDNGRYMPVAGGALVNAGADVELSSTTDLAENRRIVGRRIDIGCYEGRAPGFFLILR